LEGYIDMPSFHNTHCLLGDLNYFAHPRQTRRAPSIPAKIVRTRNAPSAMGPSPQSPRAEMQSIRMEMTAAGPVAVRLTKKFFNGRIEAVPSLGSLSFMLPMV
jgi:hypothetical protein